jgi:GntR family transcriptional regulator
LPVKQLESQEPRKRAAAAPTPLPVPLFEHVKRLVSEAILMGTWPPGHVLPGEVALATQYGVAVGTVRRALADLVAEGMLMRRPRTGTVVTGRAPQHSMRFFFQYFRLHGRDGSLLRSATTVLSIARGAPHAAEAHSFQTEPDAAVIRLHRLRLVGGAPVMHERIVLPESRLPDFPSRIEDMPELLYRTLLERYGIRVSAVRESVTAELGTDEDVKLLGVRAPFPLLVIQQTAFDQAGLPIILSHQRASTQDCCYLNEVR